MMDIITWLRRKIARFPTLAGLLGLIAAILCVTSRIASAVPVDQRPLTTSTVLKPNLVLMLDDSGSMDWDYMPDWDYINRGTNADGYQNSKINFVYYDPNVIYTPPPKADGSGFFPNSPGMTKAYKNGFRNRADKVDVRDQGDRFSYSGLIDVWSSSENGSYNLYEKSCGGSVEYSDLQIINGKAWCYAQHTTQAYEPTRHVCDNGDSGPTKIDNIWWCTEEIDNGESGVSTNTYRAKKQGCGETYQTYDPDTGKCYFRKPGSDDRKEAKWYCNDNDKGTVKTDSNGKTYLECKKKGFAKAFLYRTGSPGGNQTNHYIAEPGVCATAVAAFQRNNCTDADQVIGYTSAGVAVTAGQNVANWFSYYRTRMLMAKSGVMKAFSTVDPKYRIGFGSINGSNVNGLGNKVSAFKTTAGNTTRDSGLAKVAPFGDGTSGTQKELMWDWLIDITPDGETPLRGALKAVGEYYYTDPQPWRSFDSAGNSTAEELACRASYTILTTDGFWNGKTPGIGNIDGIAGDPISKPDNSTPFTYQPVAPFSDGASDTLADVAMKYWRTDLRPTANVVPSSDADLAYWQHMTTFTMGMGFSPVDSDGNPIDVEKLFAWAQDGAPITGFTWPIPGEGDDGNGQIENIADLVHAAINGHGAYYSALSPESFSAGLKDALKRADAHPGTASGVAANSTELDANTRIYKASYTTGTWEGELFAYSDNVDTHSINDDPDSVVWKASERLKAPADRPIYAGKADSGATGKHVMVEFERANLSSDEQQALGTDAATQSRMVAYLRGDQSQEMSNGGSLRNRTTVLGDIVHSQPVYVGAPNPETFNGETFPGSDGYISDYAGPKASRDGVVYVAANDGMLHGFNAENGDETFAYLPAAVIRHGLKDLANPDYGLPDILPHQYFNDGELTVADAYIGGKWKTVLVGTTGRGPARAVYALDVTDPYNVEFLWEHSADDGGDSKYIGQMAGKPVIVQTTNGWAVLIGNGYNSDAGTAALLEFDLASGTLSVHTTDSQTDNGLAAPATWIRDPSDGLSTVAYAGDLKGRVWEFDLGNAAGSAQHLFTTSNNAGSAGNAQPITAGMLVAQEPGTENRWLFFGTGRWLGTSDLSNTDTQSWYGIIVETAAGGQAGTFYRNALERRMILPSSTRPDRRTFTSPGTLPTGKLGWYVDLTAGERIVTPSQLNGNVLFNTSRIPDVTDVCNPGGSGWLMYLDAFTGTRLKYNFVDVGEDGSIGDEDNTTTVDEGSVVSGGKRLNSTPNLPVLIGGDIFVSQVSGDIYQAPVGGPGGKSDRISWRELTNE